MNDIFDLIYFADEPLKTLVAIMIFSFTFEFVLSFAYVLRSAKNGVGY